LDYLMVFRHPYAPGSDRAMLYAARRKSSASARWDCAPCQVQAADFFHAIEIGEGARDAKPAVIAAWRGTAAAP
jgi:hypothetical protein